MVCANTTSKATLRAALHEFISTVGDPLVNYFPSFELINNYVESPWLDDNRHISQQSVDQIMQIFSRFYLRE